MLVTVLRSFQQGDKNISYISSYKAPEAVLGGKLMGNAKP